MTHSLFCQGSIFDGYSHVSHSTADELAERPYERLRRMLDRAELSNGEVAASIEVAPETVSRWRSGQQDMRPRDLRAIIALLATRGIVVTEDWVRTGGARAPGETPGEPSWKRSARKHGGALGEGTSEPASTKKDEPARKAAGGSSAKRPDRR